MKQITLNIPDDKYQFFLDLIENLGLNAISSEENIEIPEEQRAIVMDRIKNSNPDNYVSWEDARKQIKLKN